ncbi:glycosyltransferase family 2 protein [archaeon]|nr:glycosyltransferase family 2 protein [archaeon]MBT4352338.1 glycosyltransferase family 2 protein [archaeon]MBT4647090.1 glycosyltransferase family 2 protein [archaeon]MBT6820999.1 glycosyltransferase family 2 protein [archaeon]MBT7392678.1 glycosyltransferase family 2 protein [archaeon]
MTEISIVLPTYNEEESVKPLYDKLNSTLKKLNKKYEIIFIDDGSSDNTYQNLLKLKKSDKNIKIIKFRSNFGQTAAMDAGFKAAKGKIIIAMDADLQNDPTDIPKLLNKIDQGFDVVSGWRYKRQDSFSKKIFSKLAHELRRIFTGEKIHDSGCSLKAYRKECFDNLDLYGEMHRYIPAILKWRGFKITEVKVNHKRRQYGKTKYNLSRVYHGFLDLILVVFWQKFSARPIHLFGGIGLLLNFFGILIGIYLSYLKIFFNESIANRPLLLLSIMSIIIGIQFIIFGILADMILKLYYKDNPNYRIEKID